MSPYPCIRTCLEVSRSRRRCVSVEKPVFFISCLRNRRVVETLRFVIEELANFRKGATFYEEASKYFARMNEDIRRHDKQVVYSSFCEEMDRDRDM